MLPMQPRDSARAVVALCVEPQVEVPAEAVPVPRAKIGLPAGGALAPHADAPAATEPVPIAAVATNPIVVFHRVSGPLSHVLWC